MSRATLARVSRIRGDLASGATRRARKAAGVNLAEVAAELGVTPQAVSQWERGVRVPDAGNALAYGRLLDALARETAPSPAA